MNNSKTIIIIIIIILQKLDIDANGAMIGQRDAVAINLAVISPLRIYTATALSYRNARDARQDRDHLYQSMHPSPLNHLHPTALILFEMR